MRFIDWMHTLQTAVQNRMYKTTAARMKPLKLVDIANVLIKFICKAKYHTKANWRNRRKRNQSHPIQ